MTKLGAAAKNATLPLEVLRWNGCFHCEDHVVVDVAIVLFPVFVLEVLAWFGKEGVCWQVIVWPLRRHYVLASPFYVGFSCPNSLRGFHGDQRRGCSQWSIGFRIVSISVFGC